MVNHYYVYLVDEDFGPLFVKFCSYFPYNAKLCINGHGYLKRQLAKEGIAFEALDNGVLSCADPAGLLRVGHAREPRPGPSRPRAVDLRQTRHQAHALAVPNPRNNRRGDPVAARRLQALAHQKQARRKRRDHKEGRALRTETVINAGWRLWERHPFASAWSTERWDNAMHDGDCHAEALVR